MTPAASFHRLLGENLITSVHIVKKETKNIIRVDFKLTNRNIVD